MIESSGKPCVCCLDVRCNNGYRASATERVDISISHSCTSLIIIHYGTLHPLWFEHTHSEKLILIEDNRVGKALLVPLLYSPFPCTNNLTILSDVG